MTHVEMKKVAEAMQQTLTRMIVLNSGHFFQLIPTKSRKDCRSSICRFSSRKISRVFEMVIVELMEIRGIYPIENGLERMRLA